MGSAAPQWHPSSSPRVSVVIATRNRRQLLSEAVGSVLSQTLPDLELIVVDDASTDDTASWLAGIDDDRVKKVTLASHRERSAARNAGLAQARGRFVLFLDDDDLLVPTALETLHAAAERAGVALAAGQRVRFDETGPTPEQSVLNRRLRRARSGPIWAELDACTDLIGGTVLFDTESVRAVGGFDEQVTHAEDRHLIWRLAARGHSWALLPDCVLWSRTHPGQQPQPTGEEWERRRRPVVAARAECQVLGAAARRRLAGWDEMWSARTLSQRGERRKAVPRVAGAVAADPSLLRSPLFVREAVRTIGKAAVPGFVLPLARTTAERASRAVASRFRHSSSGQSLT